MSYTKREWATGNVVGAVDLNRIENGIEEAGSGSNYDIVVRNDRDDFNTWYVIQGDWETIAEKVRMETPILITGIAIVGSTYGYNYNEYYPLIRVSDVYDDELYLTFGGINDTSYRGIVDIHWNSDDTVSGSYISYNA